MEKFEIFKQSKKSVLSAHPKEVIVFKAPKFSPSFANELSACLKEHYVDAEYLQATLQKWGRPKTAEYVVRRLPTSKIGRSGDFGEILATEYINASDLPYTVPIKRLRWKDHPQLPMRGDDIIGFAFDGKLLQFLKAEAKSYKNLTEQVVGKARQTLEANNGLPFPHTLGFIAERLFSANEKIIAAHLDEYIHSKTPEKSQVAHLIFVVSGNDCSDILTTDVASVKSHTHYSVGMYVSYHQDLIKQTFEGNLSV